MLFMINTLMLKNNRTCSNISKNYSITLISMSIEIKRNEYSVSLRNLLQK